MKDEGHASILSSEEMHCCLTWHPRARPSIYEPVIIISHVWIQCNYSRACQPELLVPSKVWYLPTSRIIESGWAGRITCIDRDPQASDDIDTENSKGT